MYNLKMVIINRRNM